MVKDTIGGDDDRAPDAPSAPDHPSSLEGLHGSVAVPAAAAGFTRQLRAFVGPALLVAVGYMDPGNWGTDLTGRRPVQVPAAVGRRLASGMAVFMQVLSARLGVVTGKDLAQAMRDWYPAWTGGPTGSRPRSPSAPATWPRSSGRRWRSTCCFTSRIVVAVLITAADVVLLLALQRFGMRTIEAVVPGAGC